MKIIQNVVAEDCFIILKWCMIFLPSVFKDVLNEFMCSEPGSAFVGGPSILLFSLRQTLSEVGMLHRVQKEAPHSFKWVILCKFVMIWKELNFSKEDMVNGLKQCFQ